MDHAIIKRLETVMIGSILRLAIGLISALAVLLALRIWAAPGMTGAALGLSVEGAVGLATLRADIAGFFAGVGLLALAGVVRNDRRLLVAPMLLVGLALLGRVITLALDGLAPPLVPPMVVETVVLVLLAGGYRTLGDGSRPFRHPA